MFKRYAIVNDVDKPQRRHVAELVNGKFYYMARAEDPYLKQFDGYPLEHPAWMEDFGFTIQETSERTLFIMESESKAVYRDGKPRYWQGELCFSLPRVKLYS